MNRCIPKDIVPYGGLAQLGERMAGSHEVIGSSPLSSTFLISSGGLAQLGERMAGSHEVIGSSPLSSTFLISSGGLAQLGERMAGSHEVIGSSPLSSTFLFSCSLLFTYNETPQGIVFCWSEPCVKNLASCLKAYDGNAHR